MRTVDIFGVRAEIVGELLLRIMVGFETLGERLVQTVRMASHEIVEVVRLRHDTEIEERVQADEEMLAADVEVHDAEAELDVGEGEAVSQNTVGHHTAYGVTATQSFVVHALDEERVHVVVHIERRLARDEVLQTETVCERDAVDAVLVRVARYVMAEGEVKLQVVVARCGLLTIGSVEGRRVGEEQVGIDTFVRSLALVAGVVGDTGAGIGVPSAIHLIRTDQTPGLVLVVQQRFVRVEGLVVRFSRVILAPAVDHVDVAVAYEITQHTEAGVPFQVLVDRAFDIARHTDQVAFVLIEHAGTVGRGIHLLRVLVPSAPGSVIARLKTVKAVEVAHRVRQIGRVQRQTIARNEVFRVVVDAEDTVVLGRVRRLDIQRVDVFGVLLTVSVVVDVGQYTALKTVVGVIGDRRQDTEVPTGLDLTSQGIHFLRLGFFLLGESRNDAYCCEKNNNDFFHVLH